MKKFISITAISITFSFMMIITVNAKLYKPSEVIENKFHLNKKFEFNLPKGKWIVVNSSHESYYGLFSKFYTLVRLENKSAVESIQIAEMYTAGIYETIVNQAIYEAVFKNKYDGCYERPEYFIVNVYKKGSTHNCFIVRHSDFHKEFYNPDDPQVSNAELKKWVIDNKIKLPKVVLSSFHSFFSRRSAGKWYLLSYEIDPKILGAPKNKFISEESSEYHKNNILNYPEYQKIMKKWVSLSAHRHIEFENIIKVLDRYKLDLSVLSPSIDVSRKNLTNNILDQINELNNLYKGGVLTKEEFEKAKKKILN